MIAQGPFMKYLHNTPCTPMEHYTPIPFKISFATTLKCIYSETFTGAIKGVVYQSSKPLKPTDAPEKTDKRIDSLRPRRNA